MTTATVPCDCGHEREAHEQPAMRYHGAVPWQHWQEWCSECSCMRFNPPYGHPDHDPDV